LFRFFKMQPAIYDPARAFGAFAIRTLAPQVMAGPHWHGHVEINLMSGGALGYDFDGDALTVADGGAALFWAGVPHRASSVSTFGASAPELTNIYLPLDSFLLMARISPLHQAVLAGAVIALPPDTLDAARVSRWQSDLADGSEEARQIALMELNAALRRLCRQSFTFLRQPDRETGKAAQGGNIRHVVAMIRHIIENLERPLANADVAAVTGLHANYALSIFSSVMRMPMKRFIIRMRLARARALLNDGNLPVATVAASAGFGSLSQFYEAFAKAYGMTPSAARAHA
jgi:AraC family transcriptional regulator, melibiose operon regulatory protein